MSLNFQRRDRIKKGIRKKISGSAESPRLTVFRSNKDIYAQLVDDENGVTILCCSSKELDSKGNKVEVSKNVGIELAKKASDKGVTAVKFDRNGYLYHGRIKALAEGAREGGLKF